MKEMLGYTSEEELKILQDYAQQVSKGVILEIGTFQGKSSIYMAKKANVHVYTIDKYDYELSDEYIKKYGVEDKLTKIIGHPEWDKPIGMLFIDGGHTYKDVKKDYDKYEPFLLDNGVLIFHDYKGRWESKEGVRIFLEEIKEELNNKFIKEKEVGDSLCLIKK